ncbi:MAG: hypothetical protein IJY47_07695 [Clostridia bacterium]|nr:hypothetical protein [Clostridia bacterium]
MKTATKKLIKIIISIVYIVWGIYSPISVIQAVLDLNVGAMISALVGVLTLLAGIFGLIGIKKLKCRIFGVVILVVAVLGIVAALPSINVNSIVSALLAWLFILCL